jgi:hypothetical protein
MMYRLVLAVVVAVSVAACDSTSATTTTEPAVDLTVIFTGGGCLYEGPETFALGSEPTFVFVNNSSLTDLTYGIWTVPDGTTLSGISSSYATSMFEVGGDRKAVSQPPTAVDSETSVSVLLDTPGTWALVCFIRADGVEYRRTFVVSDA